MGSWRVFTVAPSTWRHMPESSLAKANVGKTPCALDILDSIFFKDMDLASVPRPNHGLILDYIAYSLTLVT